MKISSYLAIASLALLAACGNQPAATAPAAPAADNNAAPASQDPEGLALMKKSDCSTCHAATSKLVGPSYKDIAAKYPADPANVSALAKKVMNGSSGVWGSVPMTSHPSLSQPDAEKMIGYILTVKLL